MTAVRKELGIAETARVIDELGVPSCPLVLADLVHETVRPLPDIGKAVQIIAVDAELSRAVLHTVNAPLYGLPRKATTLNEAIEAIGLRSSVSLVAGLTLQRMFQSIGSPWSQQLWNEISQLAVIVAYLARELGVARFEEAHMFGLFRHAGVPLLIKRYAGYRGFLEQAHSEAVADIQRQEQARFGVDHARASAVLARSWRLPERIWCAIQLHHVRDVPAPGRGETPEMRMVAIGALADCLQNAHRRPGATSAWMQDEAYAIRVLGIKAPTLAALRADVALMVEGS